MPKSVKQTVDAVKEEALQLVLEIEQFNRNRQTEVAKAAIAYLGQPILELKNDDEMAILPEFMRKIAMAWPSMKLDLQVYTEHDVVYGRKQMKTILTATPVWSPSKPGSIGIGCRPERGAGNMRVFKMELEKIEYSIPEPAVFRAHVTAAWEAYREVAKLRKKVQELESALRHSGNSSNGNPNVYLMGRGPS